jgi:hypothetical protein
VLTAFRPKTRPHAPDELVHVGQVVKKPKLNFTAYKELCTRSGSG